MIPKASSRSAILVACLLNQAVLGSVAPAEPGADQSQFGFLYPRPQVVSAAEGKFQGTGATIYAQPAFLASDRWVVAALGLEDAWQPELKGQVKLPAVIIGALTEPAVAGQVKRLGLTVPEKCQGGEGYVLAIRPDVILVGGGGQPGLFYGVQTLRQLVGQAGPAGRIGGTTIYDWPDLPMRAVHYIHCNDHWGSGRKPGIQFDEALALQAIDQMGRYKLNTIVLTMGNSVRWKSHPEIALADAWTVEKFKTFVAEIRKQHIEVIPEFNLSPTHDNWLGPEGDHVDSAAYRRMVEEILSEAIEVIGPPLRYVHLGLDEEDFAHAVRLKLPYMIVRQTLPRWKSFCGFLDFLKSKGVHGMVWADVLCDRDANPKRWEWELLAQNPDLYAKMKERCVFVEWFPYAGNYNFDITEKLVQQGFTTVIASWVRSLSPAGFPGPVAQEAKALGSRGVAGALQTLWRGAMKEPGKAIAQAAGPFWNAANPGRVEPE